MITAVFWRKHWDEMPQRNLDGLSVELLLGDFEALAARHARAIDALRWMLADYDSGEIGPEYVKSFTNAEAARSVLDEACAKEWDAAKDDMIAALSVAREFTEEAKP